MAVRLALLLLVVASAASGQSIPATSADTAAAIARGEWPTYGGTYASTKYSPLDQITADNVGSLRVAWRWTTPDEAVRQANRSIDPSFLHESTPLMVGGVLYTTTSLSQVAAIDAVTGRTKWTFDPQVHGMGMPANNGWLHRGLAYWRDGQDERVIMLTAHGYMLALDAKTGRPVAGFGENGRIDMTLGLGRPVETRWTYGHTSPPVIVRDVIVVGSSITDFPLGLAMPPGDIRGFDVRTGTKLWTFRAMADPEQWKAIGGTNVWTLMSADEDLGYVYLPFGTPANDYYGGHRPGDNLYAESLVCLDAKTGRRVWHYQIVRHGLWDYDLPAAPLLFDTVVDGKPVKAVAQATKQGFVFVFDRVTGAPIWPIEDRAVPQSTVPGETTAATQPFPTKPAAIEIQGVREADLIDVTPQLRQEALAIVRRYEHGPLYTPPSERGTIAMPSVNGGASWAGGAWDPETNTYYVTTIRLPYVITLYKSSVSRDRYVGRFSQLAGPQGLPLFKPPWGSLLAIDMRTGEHKWRAPVGSGAYPALRAITSSTERRGWPSRSFALVTKTVVLVVQMGYHSGASPSTTSPGRRVYTVANREPKLYAYDKATGALLAEVALPSNASGSPITYMAGGKQYVAFPVGGSGITEELIALTLP